MSWKNEKENIEKNKIKLYYSLHKIEINHCVKFHKNNPEIKY